MTLDRLEETACFTVLRITFAGETARRLADMGFYEGATGCIMRCGFFGGPIQVRIERTDIMVRAGEAAGVEVVPVGDVRFRKGYVRRGGMTAGRGAGPGYGRGGGRGWGSGKGMPARHSPADGSRQAGK